MIADDCFANPGQKNSSTVSNSMSDYDSEWWWVNHSYYTIYPDMQKVYELAKNILSAAEQIAKNAYKCIIRAKGL